MRQPEKVIIACYLLDEGLDGGTVAAFLNALEAGVAAGEQDAVQMREEFRIRPSAGLPGGILGEIVSTMRLVDQMQEREAELESICKDLGLLQRLVSDPHPHDLAAKIALRRIAELAGRNVA